MEIGVEEGAPLTPLPLDHPSNRICAHVYVQLYIQTCYMYQSAYAYVYRKTVYMYICLSILCGVVGDSLRARGGIPTVDARAPWWAGSRSYTLLAAQT